ncbi:MAG: peptide ABC transporter ATP-binding protein [Confluentimicrobium sp.]|jgi:oligopeptide/dipeptide ABC transporter ATP-binding protein|uniref:ABC transporter ATP-binding protein n=1 Tax=Actibacterium sp. TaxID=1872125 RepID=UPI000C3A5B68|nr:ABC transporter ATP-binding protein [Actibacterium sp.]MBC57161.1 peptide ABC transporter ATP-binding protein [Actibacterium sp.]|tara:strand:+ start:7334 stop:8326 length:993 start_codon:yes stop_codon:yes gene_type:complete
MTTAPILSVESLTKTYRSGGLFSTKPPVQAVAGVSFDIAPGETLALVGESGCGKSTIGRVIMNLTDPTSGHVVFDGSDLATLDAKAALETKTHLQMIFQDPFGSLNPRKTVRQILSQPFRVAGISNWEPRVLDLLRVVGMTPPERFVNRMPHEFSGGQRQRIAIARAFALQPKLIVADECVSALDVSVRAQILKLMKRLQQETQVSYLFISHDLGVVRSMAHRVAVMYLGRLVEIGPVEQIFNAPAHPYTQALLSASPVPDPERERTKRRIILRGDIPSPSRPPSGCRFHTRCPIARPLCSEREPVLEARSADHPVACHFSDLAKADAWT